MTVTREQAYEKVFRFINYPKQYQRATQIEIYCVSKRSVTLTLKRRNDGMVHRERRLKNHKKKNQTTSETTGTFCSCSSNNF